MIEPVIQRLNNSPQVGIIHHPTSMLIYISADMNLDMKGMAVQSCTFVAGRNIGQVVRCLDLKHSENIHASIVGLAADRRNRSQPKNQLIHSTFVQQWQPTVQHVILNH